MEIMFDANDLNESTPAPARQCLLPDFTLWYAYETTHLYLAFAVSGLGVCGHSLLILILTRRKVDTFYVTKFYELV